MECISGHVTINLIEIITICIAILVIWLWGWTIGFNSASRIKENLRKKNNGKRKKRIM